MPGATGSGGAGSWDHDRPPRTGAQSPPAGEGGRTPEGEHRPPPRGIGVVTLLAVAVVAAALAGPWDPTFRSRGSEGAPPPPEPDEEEIVEVDPLWAELEQLDLEPWDLRWLAALVAILVIGAIVRLLWSLWLRREPFRRGADEPEETDVTAGGAVHVTAEAAPDLATLREGLEGADDHLSRVSSPQDAVVAAWVRLEEAAERSGVARDPASTPTEFTVAVLDRTAVDPRATRTLLDLYLRARFGDEPLTPDDVAAAQVAVRTLADGLEGR